MMGGGKPVAAQGRRAGRPRNTRSPGSGLKAKSGKVPAPKHHNVSSHLRLISHDGRKKNYKTIKRGKI
jgi:hypothetical protein